MEKVVNWERLTYVMSALGSMLAILYGVYVGTSYIKDWENKVEDTHQVVLETKYALDSKEEAYEVLSTQVRDLSNEVKAMGRNALNVVYVNTDHIIVRLPDGETQKIPMRNALDNKIDREDAEQYVKTINGEIYTIKKILLRNNLCTDLNFCKEP
jgi:hypothetical protein